MMNFIPRDHLSRQDYKRKRAMENWVRLFRAYKAVRVADLGSLNVNFVKEKLGTFQANKRRMLIHARWRKLTNALLAAYDDQFVQKWKRIVQKLETHSKHRFQLRSFYQLDAKTVAKLIREDQANIKKQTLINIKNWKKLIGGMKKKHAKRTKINKLYVLGRWRILS